MLMEWMMGVVPALPCDDELAAAFAMMVPNAGRFVNFWRAVQREKNLG
jgi:hypothetical protein